MLDQCDLFSLDSILFSTFECDPVASTTPSNENRFLFLLFCKVVFHRLPVSCVLHYEKKLYISFHFVVFFELEFRLEIKFENNVFEKHFPHFYLSYKYHLV